jgi:tol-pal system protein YbgF
MRKLIYTGIFFFLAGCVATGTYDTRTESNMNYMMRELTSQGKMLRKQEEEIAKLQRAVNGLSKNFLENRKRVDRIYESNEKPLSAINAIRVSQEQIQGKLMELNRDVQILNDRFDENKYDTKRFIKESLKENEMISSRIEEMNRELTDLAEKTTSLTARLAKLEKEIGELKKLSKKTTLRQKKQVERKLGERTRKEVYQSALKTFREGRYKEARKQFEDYLKASPDTELSDNAQFWIGETYYKEGNFENAILEYEKLIKNFPRSDKVPGAMLKQAYAFSELGDRNTTIVILSTLKERFPKSKEAKLAGKKLAELGAKK